MWKKNILKGMENTKCKITRKIIFFFYIMHHSYYYIIYNWQINWHFKLFEIGPRILLFIPHNHIIIICLFLKIRISINYIHSFRVYHHLALFNKCWWWFIIRGSERIRRLSMILWIFNYTWTKDNYSSQRTRPLSILTN